MKPNKWIAGFVLLTIKELQFRKDSRPVSLNKLKARTRGQVKAKELEQSLEYLGRLGEVFMPKKGFVKWV